MRALSVAVYKLSRRWSVASWFSTMSGNTTYRRQHNRGAREFPILLQLTLTKSGECIRYV